MEGLNMFTQARIEEMLQEAIEVLNGINVPIEQDICPTIDFPKATSFYGMCSSYPVSANQRKMLSNGGRYHKYIRFSEYARYTDNEKQVWNTIYHELLHTIKGCMNHGKEWQKWADIVNKALGFNIQRCGGDKEESLAVMAQRAKTGSQPVHMHQVSCSKCGRTWTRTRESNLTLHPETYFCKCGGRIKRDF